MQFEIDEIFLSKEFSGKEICKNNNDTTEVIVKLKNGKFYNASFFSYDFINRLNKEHINNKEFLSGKYFWKKDMILVENCSRELVELIVQELIEEGNFGFIFNIL